jgi:hypothetical protein
LLITNVPSGRICCRHRPTPSRGAPDRDAGPSTRKDGPDLLPTGFSSHDKSPARRLLPVRVLIQIFCGLQSRVVPIPGPDHVLFESVYHLLLEHDEPAYAKQDEKWDSLVPASGQVQLDRVQRKGASTCGHLQRLELYQNRSRCIGNVSCTRYNHYVLKSPEAVDVPIQLIIPSQLSLQTDPAQTSRHAPVHRRCPGLHSCLGN